jgi:hypothetical protein
MRGSPTITTYGYLRKRRITNCWSERGMDKVQLLMREQCVAQLRR